MMLPVKKMLPALSLALVAGALAVAAIARMAISQSATPPTQQSSQRAMSVRVVEAHRGTVQSWVFAEGTARAVRREYLTFETAGRIVYVKPGLREGARVKAGDVLAHQDQRRAKANMASARAAIVEAETQVAVARAELRQAQTEETLAQKTFQRFATLLERHSASRQEYDQAHAQAEQAAAAVARARSQVEAAQARVGAAIARLRLEEVSLEETQLRVPIDGMVARLNIEPGYYFLPSLVRTDSEEAVLQTLPILVIDPNRFEITVDVPAHERGRVQAGQTVLIRPGGEGVEQEPPARHGSGAGQAGQPIPALSPITSSVRGTVYSVTPLVSPGKCAIQVKVRTSTGAEQVQDGMFVTVWIAAEERQAVVVVPAETLLYRDNAPFVFVVHPETRQAALRPVTLGIQSLTTREVVSGVIAGELLVTEGRYQLSDGARVDILEHDATTKATP